MSSAQDLEGDTPLLPTSTVLGSTFGASSAWGSIARWWKHPIVQTRVVPTVAMVINAFIFGGYAIFTQVGLQGNSLNPLVFAFLRDTFASILLLAFAYWLEQRKPKAQRHFWVHPADYGIFVLIGLCGVWGAQGMSALAIGNLDAVSFSLATPAMPVVTLLLGLATGVEPFDKHHWACWGKIVGITTTVVGAILMPVLKLYGGGARGVVGGGTSSVDVHAGGSSGLGDCPPAHAPNAQAGYMYLTLQLLLGGAFTAVQKPVLYRYPSIVVAAWGYTFGTGLLALSVLTGANQPADWTFNPTVIYSLIYAIVFASFVAYGVIAAVNSLCGPLFIMGFSPLSGIITAVLSVALRQPLAIGDLIGGAIVCIGIFIVAGSKYNEPNALHVAVGAKFRDLQPGGTRKETEATLPSPSMASSAGHTDSTEALEIDGGASGGDASLAHRRVQAALGGSRLSRPHEGINGTAGTVAGAAAESP